MTRTCGECTLCCKVMGVAEILKPVNVWCPKVSKDHHSCTIHNGESYPVKCKEFACLWLIRPDELPDWLRPDKVHAFFTGMVGTEGLVLNVDAGYPLAYKEQPLKGVVDMLAKRGMKLLMMIGSRVWMMYAGEWRLCEQIRHPDGRIEAVLRGVDVPQDFIDALVAKYTP